MEYTVWDESGHKHDESNGIMNGPGCGQGMCFGCNK